MSCYVFAILGQSYERMNNKELSLVFKLNRKQILFVKEYFETADVNRAGAVAGFQEGQISQLTALLNNGENPLGLYYEELCIDETKSSTITRAKKRLKLWELIEWATEYNAKEKPNDIKSALMCIDMLNRMDGHYAPMELNTKSQIQKQTVNFTQQIPKDVPKANGFDDAEKKVAEIRELPSVENG